MGRSKLTLKELYKLSESTTELYRTADRAEFAQKINKLAGEVLGFDHSGFWEIDFRTFEQKNTLSHPELSEMAEKTWPIYTHYATRYPKFFEAILHPSNRGKVRRSSDLLPHALVEPTGFVDEYARPAHCEFQLLYYFNQHGPRTAFLNCNRNARDYSVRDKMILEFLAPHLQAAYENTSAIEDRQSALDRASAVREALPVECIWLDQELRVREATPGIHGWVREFFQHEFTVNALPEKIMAWLRTLLPLGSLPAMTPLVVQHDSASLKIRIYPEKLPGLHLLTFTRRVTKPTLTDISTLGLTRREGEVLLWVTQAKTNDEIARLLGCSKRTIAKHMEGVLLKLKVENRASAMLVVADLLQG